MQLNNNYGKNREQGDLPKDNLEEEPNKNREISIANLISSYFEPTFIIAIITVIFYLLSYAYYASFSETLSIPYQTLSLPPITFFLKLGYLFQMLPLFFCILPIIYFQTNVDSRPTIFKSIICLIFACYFLMIAVLYEPIILSTRMQPINLVVHYASPFIIFAIYYLLLTTKKITPDSLRKIYEDAKKYPKISLCSVLCIIILLMGFTIYSGYNEATRLIQYKSDFTEIQFDLKSNASFENSNEWFIFVLHRDNRYFIMSKNTTTSLSNCLYVIPDEEVKKAIIRRRF